jgi:hypothetical protein
MVEAQAKAQATQRRHRPHPDQRKCRQTWRAQQKQQSDIQMEQLKLAAQRKREQDEFAHKQMLDKHEIPARRAMAQIQAAFDMKLEAFKAEEQIKIDRAQAAQQAKAGVGEV